MKRTGSNRGFADSELYNDWKKTKKSGKCVVIFGPPIDYAKRKEAKRKINRYEAMMMKKYERF